MISGDIVPNLLKGFGAGLALALVALTAPAFGQTIGNAATVRNDVNQVRGGAASPITLGEAVVRNEVVRTGVDSATRLVFRDSTNLSVGPSSTVTLDTFVFSEGTSAGKVGVNLAKGAFRFATGGLDKSAYEIKTPVATIGVRGTIFDVLNENGRTTVRLEEGQVIVCTRDRRQCVTVSNAGDTVVVTASGVSRTTPGGRTGFSFAALCGNDGLCGQTQYASDPGAPGSLAALCGR